MERKWLKPNTTWSALAALALALLFVPGFVGATPVAAGAPVTTGNVTQWAYGVQENVSFSVITNGTSYMVDATFAYAVIFTQTNTTNTTFSLEVQRTLGFTYDANYTNTVLGNSAKVTGTGFESDTGFANFTDNGTVYENGTPVPAVALVNTAHTATQSLVEAATATIAGRTASASFNASLASSGHATYSPALGIVPVNVSTGQSWNSSSWVDHVGWAKGSAVWNVTGFRGTTDTGSVSLSANTSVSGTESVWGTDLGIVSLRNGLTGSAIQLTTAGPLHARDGVIWTASGEDLFEVDHPNMPAVTPCVVAIATERFDWTPHFRAHFGVQAATVGFNPAPDVNPMAGASVSGTTSGGIGYQAAPSNGQELQAQPESVAQAQAESNCLDAGHGVCATSAGSGGILGASGGLVLVVGVAAAVAVAAIVGAVLVTRRRGPKA
jgi:hypothetical protein